MIPVVFNGSAAYLIDDVPNWDHAVSVSAAIPSAYERGLTGKETRRQTGDTLRLSLKFTSLVIGDVAVTNLRNSLQALNVQPVLCPFWPGQFAAGAAPEITAQYYALFNADGSYNSIQAAAALPFACTAYPLCVGILKNIPAPKLHNMSTAEVDYEFDENDNTYLLTPPVFIAPAGIAAASGVRPLFPWRAEWSASPESGGAEVDIDRSQIGAIRALSQIYYTQRNRRRINQSFKLLNADPFDLLSFFVSMGGEVNSFWLPVNILEAMLTANVGAADTALQVDNPANLGTNTFIILDNGVSRAPLIVTGVAGNDWDLSAAPGTAFTAAQTTIESLVLARFDTLKLELNFTSPALADAQIGFKELPWETAAVAGETIGTTMGPLPTTAMLYTFSLVTPGGTTYWRYTNFERNLTDGDGNVYTSAAIENEEISDAPNLERQNVTVKLRNFAGNPLALAIPMQLELPLELTIAEGNVTVNAVAVIANYFVGEVGEVSMDGPLLNATCMSLNWMFDRTAARRLYQNNDNWNLFEPANGLTASDWMWNAEVAVITSATQITIGTISANNNALNGNTLANLGAQSVNFFAAGYVAITTGAVTQYRMVSASTALAGGEITLELASSLTPSVPLAVGNAVQIYAGYDGQYETAITKFANGANFGGFPFIPVGNPFVMKITQNPGGGKK